MFYEILHILYHHIFFDKINYKKYLANYIDFFIIIPYIYNIFISKILRRIDSLKRKYIILFLNKSNKNNFKNDL